MVELAYKSVKVAGKALAAELRSIIELAVSVRGQALIAVSGGNTPLLVFRHLRRFPIDWKRVTVTLTDERWVSLRHSDSK